MSLYVYNRIKLMTILKSMKMIRLTSLWALLFIIVTATLCRSCGKEQDDDSVIVVSNVFTPNGVEENNYFEVTTENGDEVVSLKIYTRAGVLVFSIEAKRCIWDGYSLSGQEMAGGVYYYTAEIRSLKVSKSGFVHLYR